MNCPIQFKEVFLPEVIVFFFCFLFRIVCFGAWEKILNYLIKWGFHKQHYRRKGVCTTSPIKGAVLLTNCLDYWSDSDVFDGSGIRARRWLNYRCANYAKKQTSCVLVYFELRNALLVREFVALQHVLFECYQLVSLPFFLIKLREIEKDSCPCIF